MRNIHFSAFWFLNSDKLFIYANVGISESPSVYDEAGQRNALPESIIHMRALYGD